ncbi:hypothetical protein CIPAW_09G044500 [Carya illinoinensis]|uniref:Uncharacterized protein n=1 Tax=Carya illinoinensis TaxID=32201 RepID=A0A8T1PDV9_CARIL|nr:hypothetical protein CIPAW_09G044500 [Carya illinoinensis]KAG6694367.1 hypothetical protein I3842_09G044500 [Carya illinoinensis]
MLSQGCSLGPIHYGEDQYKFGEELKLRLAKKFVEESGKSAEDFCDMIAKKIVQLKECFDEKVIHRYDNVTLAWMLFVDGCATLQFIYCAKKGEFKELNIKNDQVAFGQQDLFLLENQLPYQLLEELMILSTNKELAASIKSFIDSNNMIHGHNEAGENEPPIHLLDLLRTSLLDGSMPSGQDGNNKHESYRNVQELRAAGIRLKPSKTGLLRNVSFSKRCNFFPGYLQLPPIRVDDSTGPKFFNLIAYEMCPDFKNDFGISSYISLLDSLIDHPDDVKELRKAHILHNLLGNDEEVAQLFNEIGTDLVPDQATYANVRKQIQNYYDTKWKTWIAEAIHDHFSSPWTFLAFLAAVTGLGLTAIQTWYTVPWW